MDPPPCATWAVIQLHDDDGIADHVVSMSSHGSCVEFFAGSLFLFEIGIVLFWVGKWREDQVNRCRNLQKLKL